MLKEEEVGEEGIVSGLCKISYSVLSTNGKGWNEDD